MKQKLKRFMAGFMAMLTLVGTLFTNGTTAFAARFCIQFLTEILHIV